MVWNVPIVTVRRFLVVDCCARFSRVRANPPDPATTRNLAYLYTIGCSRGQFIVRLEGGRCDASSSFSCRRTVLQLRRYFRPGFGGPTSLWPRLGWAIRFPRLESVLPLPVRLLSPELLGAGILSQQRQPVPPISVRNADSGLQQAVAQLLSEPAPLPLGPSLHSGRLLGRLRRGIGRFCALTATRPGEISLGQG